MLSGPNKMSAFALLVLLQFLIMHTVPSLWHFLIQREPERISVALSGSLWFSLSGSLWRSLWLSGWFSLSPTLSLCGSLPLCLLSGSLWSMCFCLMWNFCCNYVKLRQLSQNVKIQHFLSRKNGFRAVSQKKCTPTWLRILFCSGRTYIWDTCARNMKVFSERAPVVV